MNTTKIFAACLFALLICSCGSGKPERSSEEYKELLAKDSVPAGVTPIEDFLPGDTNRMMDRFYKALLNIEEMDRPVRIAYYGDSFISGDLLTQDLREMLQEKFGGSGVGAVELVKQYSRGSVSQSAEGLSEHDPVNKNGFKTDLQGMSGVYCISDAEAKAKLTGTTTNHSTHVKSWTNSQLFFRPQSSASVSCKINGKQKELYSGKSNKLQMVQMEGETSSAEWNLKGKGNVFYFASNESSKGVIVDNFGMVSVSGNQLKKIPQSTLDEFAAVRPYDLIILQYGLNVASPKEVDHYKYYVRGFKEVISKFQKAWPNAAILLVSVSDRAQKEGGVAKSMDAIRELVGVQHDMAKDCKVGFWNMYKVMSEDMGGIIKMAEQGDAEKDYTHITLKGGKVLAKPLYDALMNGLFNYERRLEIVE